MKKCLNGKQVKITGNTTNHNFAIGEMVKIINDGGCGQYGHPYNLTAQSLNSGIQYSIGSEDFMYEFGIKQIKEQIDKLAEKKTKLEEEIKFWDDVVKYLDETGSKTYEETEFKAYQVLKTINEKTSDIEKAKIIAKIVNG